MNSLKDLFTPLDKKYCDYFYYVSVISYFMFIFILLTFMYSLVFNSKKLNLNICMNSVSIVISFF